MNLRKLTISNQALRTRRRWRTAPGLEALEGRSLLSTTSTGATTNQVLVEADYQVFLGRQADSTGLAGWTTLLNNGTSATVVAQDIATSTEGLTRDVNLSYQTSLGRAPTTTELNAGIATLRQAGDSADVLDSTLLSSSEFYTNAGGTNQGYVEALYGTVLGRAGDQAGMTTWVNSLNRGTSRASVANAFLTSHERATDQVMGAYQGILGRDADTSGLNHWVGLRESNNGHAPAISEQTLLIDFLNSTENLGRISTAVSKSSMATSAQIASSLINGSYLTTGVALADFSVQPDGIAWNSSGSNSPVTITVSNQDATQPLVFTPAIAEESFYSDPLPAAAFTFLDSSGDPLNGPITVAPGQTATFQVKFDSSKVSVTESTFGNFGANLVLLNPFGRQLTPTIAGTNGVVAMNLLFATTVTSTPV